MSEPVVKLTDDEIRELAYEDGYADAIADAAAIKACKACHKFLFDFLTMESTEFCDIYGMEFLGRMTDPADEVLASWLKRQGIEVTE